MGLGAHGVGRGLLAAASAPARGWASWIGPALAAFALSAALLLASLAAMPRDGPGPALSLLGAAAFVVSCATISFAWLAARGEVRSSCVVWPQARTVWPPGTYVPARSQAMGGALCTASGRSLKYVDAS